MSSTLTSRMAAITRQQLGILDSAKDGSLTVTERDEYDELDGEWKQLSAERERTGRRTQPDPLHEGDFSSPAPNMSRGKMYREMFSEEKLSDGGFESLESFFTTVHSGRSDDRLDQLAHAEGTPSSGGYFVPEEFSAQMLDASLENEIVRPRAQVEPMNSDVKNIAGFESVDNSSGNLFGGFTANWVSEAGSIDEETGKIRKIKLEARKLALFTKSSNELLADGVNFERQLSEVLSAAASWHMDYAFLRGTGAGQPRGVLNDPALVTVAKETGQAATTLVYENLTKHVRSLTCFVSLAQRMGCQSDNDPAATRAIDRRRHRGKLYLGDERVER